MAFDLSGSHIFQANQQEVWDAMNDPDVLEVCLPSVDYIDQHATDHMEVFFVKRFGFIPIKAAVTIKIFKGNANEACPSVWRIEASGSHSLIGKAKAGADIKTRMLPDGTCQLDYAAFASFGEALLKLLGSAYEERINGWIHAYFDKFQVEIEARRG